MKRARKIYSRYTKFYGGEDVAPHANLPKKSDIALKANASSFRFTDNTSHKSVMARFNGVWLTA
jgi:hypothetical protein